MTKTLSEEIGDIIEGKVPVSEAISPKDRESTPKERTANMGTLTPGSKHKDPMPKSPADVVDTGDAPVKIGQPNPDPLKGTKGKDSSKSSTSAVGKEAMKKLKEDETVASEDEFITEDDLIAFANELSEEGYSEEQIAEAIDDILADYEEILSEEDEPEGEFIDDEPLNTELPELDLDINLDQDMEALFQGEELSEDFKSKAKLIFESVIKAKMTGYQKALDEAFEANLIEAVKEIEGSLTEDVTNYLDYVVESWVEDNDVAIEAGLRTELTEEFIEGFMTLCREHYIDVPEEKVDIIEELADKVASLEERLNEEIQTNVELNSIITEAQKDVVFSQLTSGMVQTQVEKLRELTEGVEFDTEEDFTNKFNTLKESYFPVGTRVPKSVETPNTTLTEEVESDSTIDIYAQRLGKSLPH